MDQEIFDLIEKENIRQNEGIELIASENYASKDVRNACGSILTNKYAEGYPYKRYYGGCEYIDAIEQLAIDRAKKLFNAKYANVQPHSGSQANAASYRALLPNGGKILSLVLNDGGHLTHGSPVSFSSHLYDFVFYPLDENGRLNYEGILNIAKKEKPDLIVSSGAAVAVPFFYIGKLFGAKTIYIEVFDRIDHSTITGKMVYPVTDRFIVQWEEMKKIYPKAINLGSIF